MCKIDIVLFYILEVIIIKNHQVININNFSFNMKKNQQNNKEILWYLYILERDQIQVFNLIKNFFKILDKNIVVNSIIIKSNGVLSYVKLEYNDQVYIIKNYISILGNQISTEKQNEIKNKNFILDNYTNLYNLISFITIQGIDPQLIYSPQQIMWIIYFKKFFTFKLFSINLYYNVKSINTFVYKYYIILKKKNINNNVFIKDDKINYINFLNYTPTIKEINQFKVDKLNLKLTNTKIQSAITKLNHENIFDNVMFYLNTNYPKISGYEDTFLKESFFGGRREIYENHITPGNIIINCDMPSAYFSMFKHMFPVGKHKTKLINSKNYNIKKNCFYKCLVYTNKNVLPVLPYRSNIVMYPTGTFQGLWFGEELLLFVDNNGIILEVYYEYYWDIWENTYLGLVNYINSLEGKTDKKILKSLKTHFFGSFATRDKTYTDISENYLSEKNIISQTNIYVASIITSKCRIHMYNLIKYVQSKNVKVKIVNTDSLDIECSEDDFRKLNTNLGEFNEIFKKNKFFSDAIYINNKFIFRKSINSDIYINSSGTKFYTTEQINAIKQAIYDNHTSIVINNESINLTFSPNRLWNKTLLSSSPHYLV